jgi:hypothetical protein
VGSTLSLHALIDASGNLRILLLWRQIELRHAAMAPLTKRKRSRSFADHFGNRNDIIITATMIDARDGSSGRSRLRVVAARGAAAAAAARRDDEEDETQHSI